MGVDKKKYSDQTTRAGPDFFLLSSVCFPCTDQCKLTNDLDLRIAVMPANDRHFFYKDK